jgi:hypothetical protein
VSPASRRYGRRASPARRALGIFLGAVAAAVVFLLGLGLGRALEEEPAPSTRTLVRTLRPLELPPARDTVTVRVTVTGG